MTRWGGYRQVKHRQHENAVKKQIWAYLTLRGVFAFIVFQPTQLKPGQFTMWHHSSKGIPDILGIFKGRPLAIEVKARKNKTTKNQDVFLENFRKAGGIAIVAWGIEDVERELKLAA